MYAGKPDFRTRKPRKPRHVWLAILVLVPVSAHAAACSALSTRRSPRTPDAAELQIELVHGDELEMQMEKELRAVLEKFDVEPWILTRVIRIDRASIPHSHPILTIHTRHIGSETDLLATFVHEQLHWLEDNERWRDRWRAAINDFRTIFPQVPPRDEGGARDDESTYRHLVVCELEYQAMTALVGKEKARRTLSGNTHYEWIYDKVLNDSRIRDVTLRHGLDVRSGVSMPHVQ